MIPQIVSLLQRVAKLEEDSHPPIPFEECPKCHSIVAPGKMDGHYAGAHNRP